jgi:hypothetical protein
MRPATYYFMAQTWRAQEHRQIKPDAPPSTPGRGRHARAHAPLRGHPRRALPAVARRVLAVLSGT